VKRAIGFILLACIHLFSGLAFGQVLHKQLQLPCKQVFDLSSDTLGNIYFGTDQGIYRWNGFHLKQLPFVGSQSAEISSMVFLPGQQLACRNFSDQVFILENDSLKPLRILEKALKGEIIIDLKANSQRLIIAAENAIWSFEPDKKLLKKRIQLPHVESIEVSGDTLYCTNSNGRLFVFSHFKLIQSLALPTKRVYLVQYNNKLHCIGKGQSKPIVFALKQSRWKEVVNLQSKTPTINNLIADQGYLGISSTNGFYLWNDTINLINPVERIIGSDFKIDFQQQIWFSTLNAGVFVVPNLQVTQLGSGMEEVNRFCVAGNTLYAGTRNGIIKSYNAQTKQWRLESKQHQEEIGFLSFQNDGWLYATHGRFHPKTKQFQAAYYGKDITLDSRYNTYLALHSLSALIPKAENPLFNTTQLPPILSEKKDLLLLRKQRSKALVLENDSSLYIAYNNELIHYTPGHSLALTNQQGQPIYANQLIKDKLRNLIWVASSNNGVMGFSSGRLIFHFLPDISCKRIFIDSKGICILGNKGLILVNPETGQLHNLSQQFGLGTHAFNDLVVWQNQLILAGQNEIISLPLSNLTSSPEARLSLSEVRTSTRKIQDNQVIPYSENTLKFSWDLVDLKSMEEVQLLYRLLPIDSNWNKLSANQNELVVANLSPGSYRFEIKPIPGKAMNEAFHFSIQNPIYLSIWFLIVVSLSVLILFYLVIRWVQYRTKKAQEFQTQLVASRLTALRAQMNPHFLYNVLNTLQGLIYSRMIDSAGTYISKFSDYLRNTLQISDVQEISIREEIESLKLYLELEQLRFGDEFSFSIKGDPSDEHWKIPSLLIQPFVENAVKHGLLNKKGKKQVHVRFTQENPAQLCIAIEDNGIGRKASREINSMRKDKPKSFATPAIQARINLLNQLHPGKLSLEIIDLYENSMPSGTRVELRITL